MKQIMVTRSSMPTLDEYVEEIKSIWDTHWLTNMGEKHNRLERELKNYLKVKELSLIVNGHMAIELALQAMDLTGEVITTPFTFASTTHAIVRNGLTPVFCDINPEDYTIDVTQIERLITEKTTAILPVHVYGNLCDTAAIEGIAKKHGLKVLYDAAHAFGEEKDGIGVGSFGDASCFSFHATKVFNTIEGGAVTYADPAFGEDIYRLKNFGIQDAETVDGVGANGKMNEFCAAMGLCNLKHVDGEIEKRKKITEAYRERLENVEGLRLSPIQTGVKSNYSYFPILIDRDVFGCDRDTVFRQLKEEGIIARKYFYPLTNEFECYKGVFHPEDTPVAYQISRQVITLPLYADLELNDVDRICEIILKCKH